MNPQDKLDAIKNYIAYFQSTYGKKLLYGYLHLNNHAGLNSESLYLILDDGCSFLDDREAFHAVWLKNREGLPKPPIVMERRDFERFLQIFPGHAYHMARNTRKLGPAPPLAERVSVAPTDIQMQAWSCHQGMIASEVVAPKGDTPTEKSMLALFDQYAFLKGEPPNVKAPLPSTFSELHKALPSGTAIQYKKPADLPPTPVTTLVSQYGNLSTQIFVVEDIDAATQLTDWETVWQTLPSQTEAIQLTTPDRFYLAVDYYGSVDFRLMSYQKAWGVDLLENLDIQKVNLMQDAARPAMRIFVHEFLPDLIRTEVNEENNRKIIHDFQNRLLNIRLQNELLGRLQIAPKTSPPYDLPPRDAPTDERISAIYDHLTWWSRYYYELMLTSL